MLTHAPRPHWSPPPGPSDVTLECIGSTVRWPQWRVQETDRELQILDPENNLIGNGVWSELGAYQYRQGRVQGIIFLGVSEDGEQKLEFLSHDANLLTSRSFEGATTSVAYDPILGQLVVTQGVGKALISITEDGDPVFDVAHADLFHSIRKVDGGPDGTHYLGQKGASEVAISILKPLGTVTPVALHYESSWGRLVAPDLHNPPQQLTMSGDAFLNNVAPAVIRAFSSPHAIQAYEQYLEVSIARDSLQNKLAKAQKWLAERAQKNLRLYPLSWSAAFVERRSRELANLDHKLQMHTINLRIAVANHDPISWGLGQLAGRNACVLLKSGTLRNIAAEMYGDEQTSASKPDVDTIAHKIHLYREAALELRDTLLDGGLFHRRGPLRDLFYPRPLLNVQMQETLENLQQLGMGTPDAVAIHLASTEEHLILLHEQWQTIQKKTQEALQNRVLLVAEKGIGK